MTSAAKFTKRYVLYTTIVALGVPLFFIADFYINGSSINSSGINDTVKTELTLPNFSLTTSENKPFTKASFLKEVSLVNFVFKSCPEACPLLMEQTRDAAQKSHEMFPHLKVVSITVDPNNDTIDELASWKQEFAPDNLNWTFVGGSKPAVESLIKSGFKMPVEESPDDSLGPILHSFKVAIVDHFGRIRGFYDVKTAKQRETLVSEFKVIAKEAQRTYPSH